eukprot:5016379-Pyramimonas_sp.AAC.1
MHVRLRARVGVRARGVRVCARAFVRMRLRARARERAWWGGAVALAGGRWRLRRRLPRRWAEVAEGRRVDGKSWGEGRLGR